MSHARTADYARASKYADKAEYACSASKACHADKACHAERAVEATCLSELGYQKLKCRMIADETISIQGAIAYGSFYSTEPETIALGGHVHFNLDQNIRNIIHDPIDRSLFTMQKDGVYYFSFVICTDQPAQFTMFVNGVADPTTTTASNSGATQLNLHQLINLKAGDVVNFRNYASNGPITTSIAGGTIAPSNICDMSIMWVAPRPEVLAEQLELCKTLPPCCPPPRPEPHCPPAPPQPPKEEEERKEGGGEERKEGGEERKEREEDSSSCDSAIKRRRRRRHHKH